MVRQGGRVQLEQSDMRLAMDMTKMAKEVFSCTAIEETKYLIKQPCAEVLRDKKRGIGFPWHEKVKATTESQPAMLQQNHMSGCLSCQHRPAKNPSTHWSRKESGAPPPTR